MKYDVEVTRDGRWWMVSIPAIDGLTQARRLDEVEDTARSYIALDRDVPLSTVEIARVVVDVGGEDLHAQVEEFAALRAEAEAAQVRVAERARELAIALADRDVPTRDIGSMLGVSHQRVSQLTATARHRAAKGCIA